MKRWMENPWQRFGLLARVGWLVVGGYGVAALLVIASWVARRVRDSARRPSCVGVVSGVRSGMRRQRGPLRGRAPQIRMAGAGNRPLGLGDR